MAYNILVVDENQAFATILKEGLETTEQYQVAVAHSGADALEAVVENPFDMVIVDMGLADVKPDRLVKAIREAKPSMRLMLIPLMGGHIPRELDGISIQGILPKPFFVDDLPRIVAEAMGVASPSSPGTATQPEMENEERAPFAEEEAGAVPAVRESSPVAETVDAPPPSAEYLSRLRARERDIVQLLKALNREVRAECILVTLGEQLVAFSGLLGREQTAKLARLVADSAAAASRAAAFLGEPTGHFEQSLHEGAEYCLYSLNVSEDLVLSLALSTDVPLGTLRYRARQTVEKLLELLT